MPVMIPLPEELLKPCLPGFRLSQSGPLVFEELEGYVEELARTIKFCNGQLSKIKALQPVQDPSE